MSIVQRLAGALLTLLLLSGPLSLTGSAQPIPQEPGGDTRTEFHDNEATSRGEIVEVVRSRVVSAREHPVFSAADPPCAKYAPPPVVVVLETNDTTTTTDDSEGQSGAPGDSGEGGAPHWDPALWGPQDGSDGSTVTVITSGEAACLVFYICGGERIDELFTGEISGEAPQAYAEYVHNIGAIAYTLTGNADFTTTNPQGFLNLSDALLSAGLDTQPQTLAMPVFNYCRYGPGGPLELVAAGYTPTLGWNTQVPVEYDIATSRQTLLHELQATLAANQPQLKAIPPLEQGFTYVRFPMWLWLNDPITHYQLEAHNDLATIRVSITATFNHIEWDMAGEIISCTLNDIREYPGHDPATNTPPCSHTFTRLVDYELTARIYYDIEEQIAYRTAAAQPWPPTPWTPHPTSPTITANQTAGNMTVHQLVALNTATN